MSSALIDLSPNPISTIKITEKTMYCKPLRTEKPCLETDSFHSRQYAQTIQIMTTIAHAIGHRPTSTLAHAKSSDLCPHSIGISTQRRYFTTFNPPPHSTKPFASGGSKLI